MNNENEPLTLWQTSEFAEVCGFYRQFHEILKINEPNFKELHDWLCIFGTVPSGLRVVHYELLAAISKRKRFKKRLKKRSFEYRVYMYCVKSLPLCKAQLKEHGYQNLPVLMRLHILRRMQDELVTLAMEKFPDDMHDQYVGTDCFRQSYYLKLWPHNTVHYTIYRVDSKKSQPSTDNETFREGGTRNKIEQLIVKLKNQIYVCSERIVRAEQKQMISFLTSLLHLFPDNE